jgi:uncharacterized membrane protein YfcA
MEAAADRSWRLLPSERVLWEGRPRLGVARDLRYDVGCALLLALAAIAALFAGLLHVAMLPGVTSMTLTAVCLTVTAIAARTLPGQLADSCRYMLTDRQVIWRRGRLRRTIDRAAITYARIHWHRSTPGVGHLELVRAVPFGPLARKQRLFLHDVEAPDVLFSRIRSAEPSEFAGYADVALTDRLDRGETVVWGACPAGWRMGQAEAWTALVGALVTFAGVAYCVRMATILLGLEHSGLRVVSPTWLMLFSVMAISGSIILLTGAALLWHGVWGARAAGSRTEYVLTESRLLIRRGRKELSVDRHRIVDVAELPSTGGSCNLHLILDAPDARALEASGALGLLPPPRAVVPPVLYEISESELLRSVLLPRTPGPTSRADRAAA